MKVYVFSSSCHSLRRIAPPEKPICAFRAHKKRTVCPAATDMPLIGDGRAREPWRCPADEQTFACVQNGWQSSRFLVLAARQVGPCGIQYPRARYASPRTSLQHCITMYIDNHNKDPPGCLIIGPSMDGTARHGARRLDVEHRPNDRRWDLVRVGSNLTPCAIGAGRQCP